VLLAGLDAPRVVEDVRESFITIDFLIHSRLVAYQCLAIDHHVGTCRVAQVERLVWRPLHLEAQRSPSEECGRSSRFIICSKQIGQQRSAPSDNPM